MSIENMPCACGNALYDPVYQGNYNRGLEAGYEFSLWECRNCCLVRTHPVPGVELYTSGYSHSTDASGQYARQDKPGNSALAQHLKSLVTLTPGLARLPILDVGCNGGELVEDLKQQGMDAAGCDVDPVAVEYGKKRGLRLFCQDLSFVPLDGTYGTVALIHTLEHIVPAADFLKNISSALAPGGVLHVRVPNFGGWIPKLMKENWGFLMPSLHVWQFTPETLTSCVERGTNLRLTKLECNRNLEPRAGGVRGLVKNTIMSCAAQTGHSDEIIATFCKQ